MGCLLSVFCQNSSTETHVIVSRCFFFSICENSSSKTQERILRYFQFVRTLALEPNKDFMNNLYV